MDSTSKRNVPKRAHYLADDSLNSPFPMKPAWDEMLDLNEEEAAQFDLTLLLLHALTDDADRVEISRRSQDFREFLKLVDEFVLAPGSERWLVTPLPSFGGLTPREIIDRGQIRDLRGELERLQRRKTMGTKMED